MAYQHYNFPSFEDGTDNIILNYYKLEQPLIIEDHDGNGNYGIYVVKDNTQGEQTIEDSITNGWIVSLIDNVTTEINVDNLTIEEVPLLKNKSEGDDFLIDINKYWISGAETPYPGIIIRTVFYGNGALFGKGTQNIFFVDYSTPIIFPPGTYEFYSTADFSSDNPCLETDTALTIPFTLVAEEGGFFRYSCTIATSQNIVSFSCQNGSSLIEPIWFIDRFETAIEPEVTIKNIDSIIGSSLTSIDGTGRESTNSNRELVTKSYVDKIIGVADDITLQRSYEEITISNINDVNILLHDTWSEEISDNGWTIDSSAALNNGRITIPIGTAIPFTGKYNLLECTALTSFTEYRVYKFKIFQRVGSLFIIGESTLNGGAAEVRVSDYENIGNGWEIGSVLLPPDFGIRTFGISSGSNTFPNDVYIEPIVMDNYPPIFNTKIKEIDYIIDDDNESIDGSDTPMSDPHRELVTRAKVESAIAALSPWTVSFKDIDGDGTPDEKQIQPSDPLVKQVNIVENTRGITGFYVENSENETGNDNYTGAGIVLSTSSTPYDNQTYITHHGADYYDAYLQSRGAIMTDSSMVMGAYNSTDKQGQPAFISFVVGDDYYNQKEIYKLTTNGIEMTLPDKKFFYEAGKTPQADPATWTDVRCNTVTGEIYAAAGSAISTKRTERFDISVADVGNGYIDIVHVPAANEHLFVYLNGMLLDEDAAGDFTISTNRITFTPGVITLGDKLIVKYAY